MKCRQPREKQYFFHLLTWQTAKRCYIKDIFKLEHLLRGGAVVARQAHNLKAVGSIPAPATNDFYAHQKWRAFLLRKSYINKDLQLHKKNRKLSPEEKISPKFNKNPLWISVWWGTTESWEPLNHQCNILQIKHLYYYYTIRHKVRFLTVSPINAIKPPSFCNTRNTNKLH